MIGRNIVPNRNLAKLFLGLLYPSLKLQWRLVVVEDESTIFNITMVQKEKSHLD